MVRLPTILARCSLATVVSVSMSFVWNSVGGVFIFRIVINLEPRPCRNVCFANSGAIVIPLYWRSRSVLLNLFAKVSMDVDGDLKLL